jgi:DNA-binding transcriptional LysR family regulator
MDIKQLKYLIALDQTRHFGQAAALCHITQPTLSMRIRNLEEELNLVLIQRGQRFEGFTAEGERILAWARALLAAHDGLEAKRRFVAARWWGNCGSAWCRWRALIRCS